MFCAMQFFSQWASRIKFLIMGLKKIFSYWDFLTNFFTICKTKCSILKRHVERGTFVENFSKQPTGWIGGIWPNGSPLVFATFHLFSQGLPSLCFEAVLVFVKLSNTHAVSDATIFKKSTPTSLLLEIHV